MKVISTLLTLMTIFVFSLSCSVLAESKLENIANPFGTRAKEDAPIIKSTKPNHAKQTCGNKTLCSEMASCSEACHYLNDCGLSRLDRDSDGR